MLCHIPSIFKRPQRDRNWEQHHARQPSMEVVSDHAVRCDNIRHCRYRSEFDYDLTWSQDTFDPQTITRVWYTLCPWGTLNFQAHSWLTFDFADGRSLVIAVEVRKQNAFTFSAYETMYKDFELFYVVSDERDVLYLRTHIWKNETRMYRLNVTQEEMRKVFMSAVQRISTFEQRPFWYRYSYRQCNTEIMRILRDGGLPLPWWHPLYIIVGWCDRLLWRRGLIGNNEPFDIVKQKATLNLDVVGTIPATEEFTTNLRKLLVQ